MYYSSHNSHPHYLLIYTATIVFNFSQSLHYYNILYLFYSMLNIFFEREKERSAYILFMLLFIRDHFVVTRTGLGDSSKQVVVVQIIPSVSKYDRQVLETVKREHVVLTNSTHTYTN